MKTVTITRNGQHVKTTAAIEKDGVLWSHDRNGKADMVYINSALIPDGQREAVVAANGARRITPEIIAMGIKIGDNGNGLVAKWDAPVRQLTAAEQNAANKRAKMLMHTSKYAQDAIDRERNHNRTGGGQDEIDKYGR
jgi:hypothetical protein